MSTLQEALIDASSGLQDAIIRHLGTFSVALFAVFESQDGASVQLAGTGTFVAVNDSHYILTARHVWEEVLKSAQGLGLALRENVSHDFRIDTRSILTFGPEAPAVFAEWGPDLVFLRLPRECVGAIEAYKTFYNLTRSRGPHPTTELEAWVLMGAPKALGEFTERHADFQFCGFFVWGNGPRQVRGEFDYFDVPVDVSISGMPTRFGGVSGGGLWSVLIRGSNSRTGVDWSATLQGVAFHESELVAGRRSIRCHGEQSIRAAMPQPISVAPAEARRSCEK